jgi:two-component system cell cycle response regulator
VENAHDNGVSVLVRDGDEHAAPHPQQFSESERRTLVDQLNTEARAIRRLDYERDGQLAERAFEIASATNSLDQQYTLGMATALSLLAHRNSMLGEFDIALAQAAQARALLDTQAPSVVLGDIYDCIGWSHFCLGDYAEALDSIMKSLQIAERIGDRSLQAYELDHVGSVHASSGHADVGLEMQERALAIHRELKDRTGEAFTLNNVAYTYMDLGRNDDALAAAKSALRYAEEGKRAHLQMWVLDTLADVYLHLEDADAAEECTRRALSLAREHRSETDEANGLLALGRIAYLRGQWDESLEATVKSLQVVEKRNLSVERYQCHELLSEIQEKRGDFEAALEHHKRYHELKQAKVNEETASRLANLRVTNQMETARKDSEIHRLRSLALEREVEERRVAQARLEAQASLDSLTGLFNRGHLSVLAEELRLGGNPHRPVSLMMLDIDRFKQVNDTFGHLAGDNVLVSVARQLSANTRDTDVPCRYGGDEFLVLLVGMNSESAMSVAERFRESISATPIAHGGAFINLTISAGVATAEGHEPADLQDLIERADRALYRAKQTGRDRVVVDPTRVADPAITPVGDAAEEATGS